jgi:hypothetical protein
VTLLPEAGVSRPADPHVLAAIADYRGLAPRRVIDLETRRTNRASDPVRTA